MTDFIATKLQAKDTDARTAQDLFEICIKQFGALRSDEMFSELWQKLQTKPASLDIEVSAPRQRKISVRKDERPANQHQFSKEEYFRKQYFEVLDAMQMSVESRASSSKNAFGILRMIESLLLGSINSTITSEEMTQKVQVLESIIDS